MADETKTWDEDGLQYGYVLDRPAYGGWWHLHFVRSAWSYHCDLLCRRTNILACIQQFSAGAVAESPQFYLTLDGEGVEIPGPAVGLDFRWGDLPVAAQFQNEVMQLLYASPAFQRAAAEVVARQRHLRVVATSKLSQAATDDI